MNKRKIQVVHHALALFKEKGIIQTSIQDIVEKAGISKGTFYNYFSSKNECVSAVLEHIRYEVSIRRSELQIGKEASDRHILIDQLSTIFQINQKQGIAALFEEILHSHDNEMKQYVKQYRFYELEWLGNRLTDVYGEELREYSFEAATIYFGIMHHLLSSAKYINQSDINLKKICSSIFEYMDFIIEGLINKGTSVLDREKLSLMKNNMRNEKVKLEAILELLEELAGFQRLTKPQDELTSALYQELKQASPRSAVIHALLQPFIEAYKGSASYNQARNIISMIWRFLNQ